MLTASPIRLALLAAAALATLVLSAQAAIIPAAATPLVQRQNQLQNQRRQSSGAAPFSQPSVPLSPTTSSASFDHVSSVTSLTHSNFTGPSSTSSFVPPSPTFGAANAQPNTSTALGQSFGNPGSFGTTPAYTAPTSVNNSVPTATSGSSSIDSSSLLSSIFPKQSDPLAATASTVYGSDALHQAAPRAVSIMLALTTVFAGAMVLL